MKKKLILIILGVGILIFLLVNYGIDLFFKPTKTDLPLAETFQGIITERGDKDIQIVAENLNIPWEIAFLPDNSLLVTERPGTILRIKPDEQETIEVSGVKHVGEGGLMGLALHPDFLENNFIYLYLTTEGESSLINRVERYEFNQEKNILSKKKVIIDNIPGAKYHDGGRIAFGPDGFLYVTTGDATQEDLSQDINSLAGKILRVRDDGSLPPDNPFGNLIYSYGHRNPQGLAWDEKGLLWSTEHGPSITDSGQDEINLIKKGQNYGWPIVKGDEDNPQMQSPIKHSGKQDTWAPAGMVIIGNNLLFVGLRGETLYLANINGDKLTDLRIKFRKEFGRLRVIQQGPDGWIYMATSNTDGRGKIKKNDDKIIKIHPDILL